VVSYDVESSRAGDSKVHEKDIIRKILFVFQAILDRVHCLYPQQFGKCLFQD